MGKLEPGGLRCGGTFILCYLLSEIVLLVHTEVLGQFVSFSTVIIFLKKLNMMCAKIVNLKIFFLANFNFPFKAYDMFVCKNFKIKTFL